MNRRALVNVLLATTALLQLPPAERYAAARTWWDGGVTPVRLRPVDIGDALMRASAANDYLKLIRLPDGSYDAVPVPAFNIRLDPIAKGATR